MDNTEVLIEESPVGAEPVDRSCPSCRHSEQGPPGVATSLFPNERLRRCRHCGVRHSDSEASERRVWTCKDCGLPFLTAERTSADTARCPDCLSGRMPADLPDRDVADAIEREVGSALEAEWRFVKARSLSTYLDRMAGQVCRRMDAAPARSRVVLFEAPEWWTLALPSGTVLISLGALAGLEDEAELAFVLAHELAHASTADAAVRLVRTGLQVVALEDDGSTRQPWSHAAEDLIRLGYGRDRERAADRQAIEAVMALGYDPNSVCRYLRRVDRLVAAGDRRLAELALAHPTAVNRLRAVEEFVASCPQRRATLRVNREVFRRVAGHNVLATRLERVEGFTEGPDPQAGDRAGAERAHRRLWLIVALALLAALLGLTAWQFL